MPELAPAQAASNLFDSEKNRMSEPIMRCEFVRPPSLAEHLLGPSLGSGSLEAKLKQPGAGGGLSIHLGWTSRRQHLAAACPFTWGGENSQRWAAFRANLPKYLLGPALFSFAAVTFPDGSVSTRTVTLIVPLIVFREF